MATFTQTISTDYQAGYKASSGTFFKIPPNTTMEMGNDSVDTYKDYLRFTNVTIPKGATILSAKVTLNSGSGPLASGANLKLQGIAEDNTADYSTDPSSRALTTASVLWHGFTQSGFGVYQDSPDITSIIQEIVNRTGWASGNALGIAIPDDGSAAHVVGNFVGHGTYSGSDASAKITITYSVSNLISKDIKYTIKTNPAALTQLLRYTILDQELTPVAFRGLKVAKPGHNVLNTKNPNNLNFSSDYNTLKYYLSGVVSIAVNESILANTYSKTVTLTHGLGFYPVCLAYVQDDRMANPQPMGRFQAGSGASRSFYYTISKTQITFIVNGFWLTTPDTYTVYFYYKVFKNNLGL